MSTDDAEDTRTVATDYGGFEVELDGRGVYHARGQLPGGALLLWAQTDDGTIIAVRFCQPDDYEQTVTEMHEALSYHETPEALHRALEKGRQAQDKLREMGVELDPEGGE